MAANRHTTQTVMLILCAVAAIGGVTYDRLSHATDAADGRQELAKIGQQVGENQNSLREP